MAATTPLDAALLDLHRACGRLGGHHSRQVAEVRTAAARVRAAAIAAQIGGTTGTDDPLKAVEAVLDAACDAGAAWSDLVALVNASGRRHAGPVRRIC